MQDGEETEHALVGVPQAAVRVDTDKHRDCEAAEEEGEDERDGARAKGA